MVGGSMKACRGIVWALVVLAPLGLLGPAQASVQVRPPYVRVAGRPGQAFRFEVKVLNPDKTDTSVKMYWTDIKQMNPLSLDYPDAGKTSYSCASLTQPLPATVSIAAKEEKAIEVRGTIPARATGTRHGAIMVEPVSARGPGESPYAVAAVIRVAIYVDIEIVGTLRPSLNVQDVALRSAVEALGAPYDPMVQRYAGKTAAQVTFDNKADCATWVHGYAYLRDAGSGRILQRVAMGIDRPYRVLPKSVVACVLPFEQTLAPGDYTLEVRARYGPRQQRIEGARRFRVDGPDNIKPLTDADLGSERLSLSLMPERLDFPLTEGLTTSRTLVLRNPEDKAQRCTVSLYAFTEEMDGTVAEMPLGDGPKVTVDTTEMIIPPR